MRTKKYGFLSVIFLGLLAAVNASTWTANNSADPSNWFSPLNWDNGVVPVNPESAWIYLPNLPQPVINGYANPSYMVVGNGYDLGTCVPVVVPGGHLQLPNNPLYVGYNNGKGYMVVNGGQVSGVSYLIIGGDLGAASDGRFDIWGGACSVNNLVSCGNTGKGTFYISAGQLNTPEIHVGVKQNSEGLVYIAGGTVTVNSLNTNCISNETSVGTISIVGGNVTVNTASYIGWGTNAGYSSFNVAGGTLTYGSNAFFGLGYGSGTPAWMTVTGGQVLFTNPNNEFKIGVNDSGTLTVNGPCYIETFGDFRVGTLAAKPSRTDLKSGRIHVRGVLKIKDGSVFNIEGGVLTLKGDQRSSIMEFIAAGKIIGYNGQGGVMVDYDTTYPGKTCVRAGLADSNRPAPMDFYIFNTRFGTESQNNTMASLAGLVNRTTPEMLVCGNLWTTMNTAEFWLTTLASKYPIRIAHISSDAAWFINRYKPIISGYVRYNSSTRNQAISYAGVLDAIMVDDNTLSLATAAGLTQRADVRNISQETAYSTYQSSYNKNWLFHADPAPADRKHQLIDLVISRKGYICYQPSNFSTVQANQNDNTLLIGWGSERTLFGQASLNNLMVVAGTVFLSHSTFDRWNVEPRVQKGHTHPSKATESDVHYVAFVLSDGDNLPFVLNTWLASSTYYQSPHRGTFSMNWDMCPEIANLNPLAMNYIYETGSTGANKDYFLTAGGRGICFPAQYPDKDGYAAATADAMKKADHNVISILDESFSSTVMNKLAAKREVLGIMYKTYEDYYKGRNGQITWHNGKPCVSVKYSLWDGCHSKEYIKDQLNSRPRAPKTNQDSYTIVNVHPWSPTPIDNVKWIVNNLNSKVRVVTLEELMIHLRKNFGTPVPYPTLLKIAEWWLATNCSVSNGWCSESDLDGDGKVNMKDLSIYAERWHLIQ